MEAKLRVLRMGRNEYKYWRKFVYRIPGSCSMYLFFGPCQDLLRSQPHSAEKERGACAFSAQAIRIPSSHEMLLTKMWPFGIIFMVFAPSEDFDSSCPACP